MDRLPTLIIALIGLASTASALSPASFLDLFRAARRDFGPADIPGLIMWLDASYAGSLWSDTNGTVAATNNGAVAKWTDRSSAARVVIQSNTVSRPTLISTGLYQQAALRFDGTNDFFDLAVTPLPDASHTNNLTIIAAHVPNRLDNRGSATHPAATLLYRYRASGDPSNSWQVGWTTAGRYSANYHLASGISSVGEVLSPTNAVRTTIGTVSAFRFDWAAGTTASQRWAFVDGGTNLLPRTTASTAAGWLAGHWLGRSDPTTSYHYSGTIAEVIVYAAALSDADILRVTQYLQKKWGV